MSSPAATHATIELRPLLKRGEHRLTTQTDAELIARRAYALAFAGYDRITIDMNGVQLHSHFAPRMVDELKSALMHQPVRVLFTSDDKADLKLVRSALRGEHHVNYGAQLVQRAKRRWALQRQLGISAR